MHYRRAIEPEITRHLARGKSILLLGPRQTGKTTLLGGLNADLAVSLAAKQIKVDSATDQALVREFVEQLPEDGAPRKDGR